MNKWTSTAGPRQTKVVENALREITREGQTFTEITGVHGGEEHRMTFWSPFGGCRKDASESMERIGQEFGWTITRDNCHTIVERCQSAVAELKKTTPIKDSRQTPDQVAEQKAKMEAIDAERKAEADRKAKADHEAAQMWAQKYPYLERRDGSSRTPWALASQNIRIELSRGFPGVTFSVTSKSYSGGSSIDVRWEDGPAEEGVKAIIAKYGTRSFDGMTDSEHCISTHWNTVFGGAGYVFAQRGISEATRAALRPWGQQYVQDNPGGTTHSADDAIYQLVRAYGLPAGAVVTGAERKPPEEASGLAVPSTSWRITWTLPERPATPPDTQQGTMHEGAQGITVRENEEHNGVEIRFAAKPGAEILAALKARGWRWSRFQGVWYHRRTPEALEYAKQVAVA